MSYWLELDGIVFIDERNLHTAIYNLPRGSEGQVTYYLNEDETLDDSPIRSIRILGNIRDVMDTKKVDEFIDILQETSDYLSGCIKAVTQTVTRTYIFDKEVKK